MQGFKKKLALTNDTFVKLAIKAPTPNEQLPGKGTLRERAWLEDNGRGVAEFNQAEFEY